MVLCGRLRQGQRVQLHQKALELSTLLAIADVKRLLLLLLGRRRYPNCCKVLPDATDACPSGMPPSCKDRDTTMQNGVVSLVSPFVYVNNLAVPSNILFHLCHHPIHIQQNALEQISFV